MKKLILIISLCLLLSGCYDYRELNELAIVNAISIDIEDNQYSVSAQVVNPTKEQDISSMKENSFIIYNAKGKTLQEAFRNVINDSPAKLYGAHMELLIISESVAKNDLVNILDFLSRDPEIRNEINIFIAKDSEAANELMIKTSLIDIPSSKIITNMETNLKYLGTTQDISLNYIIDAYLNPYKELTIPTIEIIYDDKKIENQETLTLDNIAIFKNNKLIDFVDKDITLGINFILDNIGGTVIQYKCDSSNYLVSEILKSSTKIEADVKNNKVIINLTGHSSISEVNCDINIRNNDIVDEIRKNINKKIEEIVKNSFYTIRDTYNTDIFNFQDLYYKSDYNYFNKFYKDNWYSEIFPNLDIEVNANYKLYEKGTTLGGIKNE